jgi:IAA-amino acid hydrolase
VRLQCWSRDPDTVYQLRLRTTDNKGPAANGDDEEEETNKTVRGAAKRVKENEPSELKDSVASFFAHQESGVSETLKSAIEATANSKELKEFLTTTRRALHRDPELLFELPHTSHTITSILEELDVSYTTGWAKNIHPDHYKGPGGYGVVAHIGSNDPDGPCIILRADMDALPILEATEDIDDFKSKTDGKMHACGHDGHTTMLLGAAALLKKVENEIQGTIRLVFQPAEEGGAGMKRMIEEGLLDLKPKAAYGFGIHVWPTLPSGTIASRGGVMMAAADMFEVVLTGKGGHAAMPHLTIDPIVAASSLILNLQSVVSRTLSPLESGVISVTKVSGGDAFNVIPGHVTIGGTIRALSEEMLLNLKAKLEKMIDATVDLHGLVQSKVKYMPDYYPPVSNDEKLFEWSKSVTDMVSLEGVTRDIIPTMGGEDFAFLAREIPSVFYRLGQGTGGDESHHVPPTDYGLHHPSFALDEDVLPLGVQLHANLALRSLDKLTHDDGSEALAEEL